jgi:chorismate mutase
MAALLVVAALADPAIAVADADANAGPLYRLVDTAAQRLATADPVAATKWINGGPITDTQRAGQVLDAVAGDAAAHGIDPNYVRTVFTDQINATEGIEYARFGQWKFDPSTAPTAAPDLADSRAAIDGFNKTMVEEIALQSNSLRAPTCVAEMQETTDAVAAARALDPLYRQALSSATRSYCTLR